MRVLLQRVKEARVEVDKQTTGAIGPGLLLLVGFEDADTPHDLDWMAGKVCNLRIFADSEGKMNQSVREAGGEILAVSQFTLFGEYAKGNRPSWGRAAKSPISQPLFDAFVTKLATLLYHPIPTGIFGAEMQVHLINDGPVTLMLDSRKVA
ncbi:MAG: D-aminoacyl-tRNA deacylase [Formivibrio sp.]|nr:D-aminoacyl-tRNA deacylase [Formivibrio sp.]